MKQRKELRTVIVNGVQLDVHYTVDKLYDEYLVSIDYIEDITGTQDLTPIISEYYTMYIQSQLEKLENSYEPTTISS